MDILKKSAKTMIIGLLISLFSPALAFASEANLKIPSLTPGQNNLLLCGIVVCVLAAVGFYQFHRVKKLRLTSLAYMWPILSMKLVKPI
jgi:K(+)-stimulated pyrophosphate-energized sodium pump